jgi:hypothetical protein
MEALTAGNVGDVASHQRAGNNPTPRERFEARAERIAASAQERSKVPAHAMKAESDERDATPFGLRRRVRPRLPFVNGEQGHGWRALGASSQCALSDSHEIDQVKRACLEAARELLLEMISLESDLVRGRAKGNPVQPR